MFIRLSAVNMGVSAGDRRRFRHMILVFFQFVIVVFCHFMIMTFFSFVIVVFF